MTVLPGWDVPADYYDPDPFCDHCNDTGWVDCLCGGDLCVCGEVETPCPYCGADRVPNDDGPSEAEIAFTQRRYELLFGFSEDDDDPTD